MSKDWAKKNPEAARAYKRKWRAANREKERAQRAAIRHADPEKHRLQGAEWRKRNPERAKEIARAWRERNKERVPEIQRASRMRAKERDPALVREKKRLSSARRYAADPAYHNALTKNWYERNRDRVAAAERARREADPEGYSVRKRVQSARRRARRRNAGGQYTTADVERLLFVQVERCFYCNASLADGFEVDHMTPLSRGGSNGPENIICACKRCNRTKHAKTAEEFIEKLDDLGGFDWDAAEAEADAFADALPARAA